MKTKILATSILVALLSSGAQAASLINGLGGAAGFGENSLAPNDDGTSSAIDITSVFNSGLNLFGTTYNSLYLNNNGNVTFNEPQSSYTPFAITGLTDNPMLAPFFADVDTRGSGAVVTPGGNSTGSNLVYWDLNPGAGTFTATWDDVGYYGSHTDLLNSFQLVLTDQGSGDFGIEFRYEALNWTTGDASGGSDGLGGTIARAGWTSGNGTDFEELAASGDQALMLALISTSNVNIPGIYRFNVTNGEVITPPPVSAVPIPAAAFLFAPALLGFMGLRRKAKITVA